MGKKYILAVPNFSEGRRKDVIEAVAGEIRKVEGVKLIGVELEYDFNRTVLTIKGADTGDLPDEQLKYKCKKTNNVFKIHKIL